MIFSAYMFDIAQVASLRYSTPASGMSHLADDARAWWRCGGAAHGGRGAARSVIAPYRVVVAGRQPYRAGGGVFSRAVRIRFSGNNAIVMPLILSKYVRRCYIIHVKLCSSENPTAQFSDSIANWPLKGGIRIAA